MSVNEDLYVSPLPPIEGQVYSRVPNGVENYSVPYHWEGAFVTFVATEGPVCIQFGARPDMQPLVGTLSDLEGTSLTARTSTCFSLEPGERIRFRVPRGQRYGEVYFAATGDGTARWTAWKSSHPAAPTEVGPDDIPQSERFLSDPGLVGSPDITGWTGRQGTALASNGANDAERVVDYVNGLDGVNYLGGGHDDAWLSGAMGFGPAVEARAVTLCAVVVRDGKNNARRGIFQYLNAGTPANFLQVFQEGGAVGVERTGGGGADSIAAPTELPDQQPVFIAVVVNATAMTLYIDGIQIGAATLTGDPVGTDFLTIGRLDGAQAKRSFEGIILEHLVLDDALPATGGQFSIQSLTNYYRDRFGVSGLYRRGAST